MNMTSSSPRIAPTLVALVAALCMSACGGASFKRTAGSKKYRALPRGTPVKVVQSDTELTGPTEEIGKMSLKTKGNDANRPKAEAGFKATAAKFGCDAVVAMTATKREVKRVKTVTKLEAGGKRRKKKVETISYEHDWTARCVRSAEAPKEVPRARRKSRKRTASSPSSASKPTVTTTSAATAAAASSTGSSSGAASSPTGAPTSNTAANSTGATTSGGTGSTAVNSAPPAGGAEAAPMPRPKASNGDPKLASEVARAFLMFSNYIANGNVNKLCKMMDTERIYFDIRTSAPKLQIKVDLGPQAACASLRTGDLGTYLRDFGPAEVHAEIATLVPGLFRIHGGAYLKLDAAQENAYRQKLVAQRAGRTPLACTMYTVLPAGNLFKVSVKCQQVNSYRLLLRRDGPNDFKLMAMTHIR